MQIGKIFAVSVVEQARPVVGPRHRVARWLLFHLLRHSTEFARLLSETAAGETKDELNRLAHHLFDWSLYVEGILDGEGQP